MSFLNRYGTQFGLLPQTNGRVYFVAPSINYTTAGRSCIANDANSGLAPDQAKLTPHTLITNALVASGDTIVLLDGAHSWTSSLNLSIAGVTVTGIPRGNLHPEARMPISGVQCLSTVTTTASDEVINVTAADVEVCHLHFIPVATFQGLDYSAAATRLHVHDCTYNITTAEATDTMGIEAIGAATDVLIDHNYFLVVGNQGPAIRLAAATIRNKIEHCTFELDGATAWDDVIEVTAVALSTYISDSDFLSPANIVLTDAVDVTSATGDGETHVARCIFAVGSDAFETAATADIQLTNNYIATVSGGTGGTLITG